MIDFKEIAQANNPNGKQDLFEMFARELLEAMGFKIIRGPTRGPDDRKDMIVSEKRPGTLGTTEVKFLVSCKHLAHSGKSVGNAEEPDIIGRLRNNGCKGFIGFYSTIISSSLERELHSSRENNQSDFIELSILDRAKINEWLHSSSQTKKVLKRYFPEYYKNYYQHEIDSKIYRDKPEILCKICGENIISTLDGYVVEHKEMIFLKETDEHPRYKVRDITFCCKGCFAEVERTFIMPMNSRSSFQLHKVELKDLTNPLHYINYLHNKIRCLHNDSNYFDEGPYRIWIKFYQAMFYFVSRFHETKQGKMFLFDVFHKYKL